jgi:hypothetical protein
MRILSVLLLFLALSLPAGASELRRQVAAAHQAVAPYQDFGAARRAGWKPFGGPASLMGQHYFDPSNPDYVSDEPLDPSRPSNLLYAEIAGRMTLVSVAYNYRIGAGEVLPEGFAGGSDVWHVHDVAKFAENVTLDRPFLRWAASTFITPEFESDDGVRRDRLAMVHLWTIPNADGPFASHNRALAYLQLGLPAAWADGASKEAARGLALAAKDGCEIEIDTEAWIANLPGRTKRSLHSVCRQVVDYMRPRLGDKASANAAGEAAWAAFARHRDELLSPAQKLRIASVVEDGPGLLCR